MQPTLGAELPAQCYVPAACEPASRGKEQCGAALRGHACDDISRISSAYRFQRRSGVQCFEELIESTVEANPQLSRR